MNLPKTEIFTGLRPTGDLTIGNYLGAIKPMVDLQSKFEHTTMFVADLHGLTDQEPETVAKYRYEIARDYMALGLDSSRATIFLQSAIAEQVLQLSMLLSRHISMAEIMRVPTLKDKLKDPEHPEQATVMLANYPIMMASDILLQGAQTVPVGQDQIAHLEVTRLLARRFNKRYGEVFVEPKPQEIKILKVMSLTGEGKMSKSKPSGAILLNESPEEASKKVKRAETALEGQMNDVLRSHFTLSEQLADDGEIEQLEEIKKKHDAGEKVMGEFKSLLAEQVSRFITDYQNKKAKISLDDVKKVIDSGNEVAKSNAKAVLEAANNALGL